VIVHLDGIYTLISADGTQEMQFQDYVVPSSAAWRVAVRQLELWLEQTKNGSGGSNGSVQDQHQGDRERRRSLVRHVLGLGRRSTHIRRFRHISVVDPRSAVDGLSPSTTDQPRSLNPPQ
jgi:hypothetical protein